MSTTGTRWAGLTQRGREHLRNPLRRTSYSLNLGALLTSAIGVVFWIVAARGYRDEDVGVSSTLIATMGFLANLATLGLRNGLVRFLPTAGPRTRRLLFGSYGVCGLAAVVIAVVFLVGQPWWAPELGLLREHAGASVFFVVATVGWVVFVLQDSVLTGLHLAPWVPVENAAYSLAKLGLLAALGAFAHWGIFMAWSIPALVILLPVTVLVLRRVAPTGPPTSAAEVVGTSAIVRFAAADHAASFVWLGATELLVLVVLNRAGSASSAYYYLSFTIAYTLYLVTANVSSAFVVEASAHPEDEHELVVRSVLHAARLVVPAAVAGVVAAPWALRVFGRSYADHATSTLRLLLLSAIPQIVVGLAIGRARVRRRMGRVIVINVVTTAMLFAITIAGLRSLGLVAVGWAWLTTQLVVAATLAPGLLGRNAS